MTSTSSSSFKYHGFATHTWAKDMLERDTHTRVIHVCNELRKTGVHMWLDQERMEGNIVDQMSQGIDDSCTFVVFLTRAYVDKVQQTHNANDSCKMEFQYGMYCRDHDSNRVLVMMEEDVKRKGSLKGPVGLHLGHMLYHDLSQGDVPSHDAIEKLSQDIKQKCRGFDIVSASAGVPQHHVSSSATPRVASQQTTHTLRTSINVYKGTIISGSAERGVGQFECVEGPNKGGTYTGPFEGDMIAGSGTVVFVSGEKYEGGHSNGVKNGKGTYYWLSGNKYEGEWKDNKINGKGTYYYANGIKYEGEYKDDKRNGNGTFYWPSGDKYEGEFKDDNMHGKGTYYCANGNKYEGEYKDDKKNGKGTFYWPSGDKYEGEFKDDNMNGKGTYYCANGNKYEGEWKDDRKNGKGTFYWPSGDKYEGEFKDDNMNGKGTYYYANGNKYEGEWKDDKQFNGKETQRDGSLVREYKNGV